MRPRVGILLAILVIVFGVALQARRAPAVFTKAGVLFNDPDDWMRVYRARTILDGGPWRIDRIPEANWPQGLSPHWTAPMDWLLAGGTLIFGPLIGGDVHHRLEVVAACTPLVLGAIYIALMIAMIRRACDWPPAIMAGLLVALSPAFARPFALGHPDHQCLLELLFLFAVSCWVVRPSADGSLAPPRGPAVLLSGIATGAAVWVAPQAIFVWAAILAGATFATWHAGHSDRAAWENRRKLWCWSALGVALLGHIIENAGQPLAASADRISLVQLAVLLWGIFVPSGRAPVVDSPQRPAWLRFMPTVAATIAVLVWFFLDRDRVFTHVGNVEFVRWSAQLAELKPLIMSAGGNWSLHPMYATLGFAPLFVLLLLPQFLRSKRLACGAKLTLALLAVGFTTLALFQRRWLDHVNVGLIPVLVIGAWELVGRIKWRKGSFFGWHQIGYSSCIVVCIFAMAWAMSFPVGPILPSAVVVRAAVAADEIGKYEKAHAATDSAPRAILCEEGDGPMLLYRTGLPVIAAPYHRGLDGILAMARFYSERDESAAARQLADLSVGYVVVPFRPHEQLRNFEYIAFGELRSFDGVDAAIDKDGLLRETFRYRPEVAQTMSYRLALQPDTKPAGLECIARVKEGAATPDGLSGLVYVVP